MPIHELKVPWGLSDDGRLVKPAEATPGQTFKCPACTTALVLKQGPKKQTHFAHYHKSCSQESILHITAKRLVQQAVQEWKMGITSIVLHRQCAVCSVHVQQALPDKVETAALEIKLSSGHVADVALLAGNEVVAAIEIRVTHAVDNIKRERLLVPFVELDGESVLEAPYEWHPLVDKFKLVRCDACRTAYSYHIHRCTELAKKTDLSLPKAKYRYGVTTCSNCDKEILVFTWPQHTAHSSEQPPDPIPSTLRYVYSRVQGKSYYMNHCPYCETGQGDQFLYTEPQGTFYHFVCSSDSEQDLWLDLHRIARGISNATIERSSVEIHFSSSIQDLSTKLLRRQ